MAWYDDPLSVIGVALVIIIAITACILVIYAMRRKEKKPKQPAPKPTLLDSPNVPFKISKSVQATAAHSAKDELRILDLEREILSDSIRRLYEAQAEGKITEVEREKLAGSYKARMESIKQSISKDESIIALHELESMQSDLMTLFSERFGELTSKVEELRTRIDVKPIREIPIKVPNMESRTTQLEEDDEEEEEEKEPAEEEAPKKKRKPVEEKPDQKTEAEKRIETIRSEVEKVLDKLGQMEIET
jgi:hypothetical protein